MAEKTGRAPVAAVLLLIAPFMVFYLLFTVYPLAAGLALSFFDGSIGGEMLFVGLKNYLRLLADGIFWRTLGNTVLFVVISTPVMTGVGLGLALLVDSRLRGSTVLRTVLFAPFVLSISVISSIWAYIFMPYTGLASFICHRLGVEGEILWLNTPVWAWLVIVVATVWWTVGFNMVLFLAGLQEIPGYLYEAARIDGAGRWRRFWDVTLPSLKGLLMLVVALQVIASFKLFGQPFLITGG
ncbi:MAG: sugar ABC transporter permease, partial [Negativicutes bacterium]|nr:sugar ABC transporter permease [Negativicutes bacterium]